VIRVAVDKSLRIKGTLLRRRSVLTREERLKLLEQQERWKPGQSVFGLPKVSTRGRKARGRKKKAEPAAAGEAPGAAVEEAGGPSPAEEATEETPAS
jgi:small basic protein (TIGR04137 family)